MTSTPPSDASTLATTLAVLDRAHALTEQRARVAQVLADLAPPYAPEVLAQAMDDCLNKTEQLANVHPLTHPYRFPWARPRNETERQQRRHRQRRGRFLETEAGRWRLMFGTMVPAIAGWAWVGVMLKGADLAVCMGLLLGLLTPTGAIIGCDRWYRPSTRLREASGHLSFPESVYLASPPARDYLRALLHSELPILLEGDVEALGTLAQEAHAVHLEQQRGLAQAQAHQDLQDRAQRLQRLAGALRAHDQATAEASST